MCAPCLLPAYACLAPQVRCPSLHALRLKCAALLYMPCAPCVLPCAQRLAEEANARGLEPELLTVALTELLDTPPPGTAGVGQVRTPCCVGCATSHMWAWLTGMAGMACGCGVLVWGHRGC